MVVAGLPSSQLGGLIQPRAGCHNYLKTVGVCGLPHTPWFFDNQRGLHEFEDLQFPGDIEWSVVHPGSGTARGRCNHEAFSWRSGRSRTPLASSGGAPSESARKCLYNSLKSLHIT